MQRLVMPINHSVVLSREETSPERRGNKPQFPAILQKAAFLNGRVCSKVCIHCRGAANGEEAEAGNAPVPGGEEYYSAAPELIAADLRRRRPALTAGGVATEEGFFHSSFFSIRQRLVREMPRRSAAFDRF